MADATAPRGAKTTLAAVVGSITAALGLFILVPEFESGRTVEATAAADGSIDVRHVKGPLHLKAYLDIVGVPTACDGITRGVRPGQVFTETQCAALLEEEIIAHAAPVMACVPGLRGRDGPTIAAVSLAFNIGPAGFCASSIARHWNAGRWRAGCDRFLAFDKAGGKRVRGLALRRARERAICLKGLG